MSIIITSLVASLTVGGKALGKSVAISYSGKIIFEIAKVFNFLEKKLGIIIFSDKKDNKNKKSERN